MDKIVLNGKQPKGITVELWGMPCVEDSSFRIKMTLADDWLFSFLISDHLAY